MFHTDAVQAVGKIPMMLQDTKIDMLSLSGINYMHLKASVFCICVAVHVTVLYYAAVIRSAAEEPD